jgi:hypothetical protein
MRKRLTTLTLGTAKVASTSKKVFAEDDGTVCTVCGGEGVPLGQLGPETWYRCRNCGMEFSSKMSKVAAEMEKKDTKFSSHASVYTIIPDGLYSITWNAGDAEKKITSKKLIYDWRFKRYSAKTTSGLKGTKAFMMNLTKPQVDQIVATLKSHDLIDQAGLGNSDVRASIKLRQGGVEMSVNDYLEKYEENFPEIPLRTAKNLPREGGKTMSLNYNRIAAQLDNLATEVQRCPDLPPHRRRNLATEIDKVTNTLNAWSRKGDVLQKDSDEPYMDTFDRSGLVSGEPSDSDEPYMKLYNEDKHSQVMNQAFKKPVPVRQSSVILQLRRAARALDKNNPKMAAELRTTAKNLLVRR